jgi:hypothetical protein
MERKTVPKNAFREFDNLLDMISKKNSDVLSKFEIFRIIAGYNIVFKFYFSIKTKTYFQVNALNRFSLFIPDCLEENKYKLDNLKNFKKIDSNPYLEKCFDCLIELITYLPYVQEKSLLENESGFFLFLPAILDFQQEKMRVLEEILYDIHQFSLGKNDNLISLLNAFQFEFNSLIWYLVEIFSLRNNLLRNVFPLIGNSPFFMDYFKLILLLDVQLFYLLGELENLLNSYQYWITRIKKCQISCDLPRD